VADLNTSELLQECEADYGRLNYSYSEVDDADLNYLKSRMNGRNSQVRGLGVHV